MTVNEFLQSNPAEIETPSLPYFKLYFSDFATLAQALQDAEKIAQVLIGMFAFMGTGVVLEVSDDLKAVLALQLNKVRGCMKARDKVCETNKANRSKGQGKKAAQGEEGGEADKVKAPKPPAESTKAKPEAVDAKVPNFSSAELKDLFDHLQKRDLVDMTKSEFNAAVKRFQESGWKYWGVQINDLDELSEALQLNFPTEETLYFDSKMQQENILRTIGHLGVKLLGPVAAFYQRLCSENGKPAETLFYELFNLTDQVSIFYNVYEWYDPASRTWKDYKKKSYSNEGEALMAAIRYSQELFVEIIESDYGSEAAAEAERIVKESSNHS